VKTRLLFVVMLGALVIGCGGGGGADTGGTSDVPVATDPGTTPEDAIAPDSVGEDAVADVGTPDTGTPDAGNPDPGTPDEGNPDPGAPETATGGTCVDIVACMNEKQCKDAACQQQCLAVGDATAQAQILALAQCQQGSCAGISDQVALALCVYETCRTQNEPCVKTGTQNCMAMMQCFSGCGQTNTTCLLGCQAQASYDGFIAYIKLAKCVQGSGCGSSDTACITGKCSTELTACQK
jgi:hypothetical protein